MTVDLFRREITEFEAAARTAAELTEAPPVPGCPHWTVTDLVAHLGRVHRGIGLVIRDRMSTMPNLRDESVLDLPDDQHGWPVQGVEPTRGPVPGGLLDWFADGAAALADLFAQRDPGDVAWSWSADHTVGFWARMQTIEAAVHRWDAQSALGTAQPLDPDMAADAVLHTFEVMAPFRRAYHQAPAGAGERFSFRSTDGPGAWTVRFDGDEVTVTDGPGDVEIAGTASDLALFLWQRLPVDRLDVRGDAALLDRYFALVPPT